MPSARTSDLDLIVIGGGPAGVVAALRAARLGARTALVTRDQLGGMAANDGPVPVRTLAHAARLMRETRQLARYGISAGEPVLDYGRLLARVREVTREVRAHALVRELQRAGVTVYEHAGTARFVDPHVIESDNGPRLQAANVIVCTGGVSRQLAVPGFELTSTHSDAWRLAAVPDSLLVIGAGGAGMVGGQMIDLIAERQPLDIGAITRLQRMKTGALIAFACEAGAILAKATAELETALRGYAHDLGLAFQIADDLLDVEGDAATVGKATGKDAAAGKGTFVTVLGLEGAKARLKTLVGEAEDALGPFGRDGDVLKMAARFVAERKA
jgi:hypothetical protein